MKYDVFQKKTHILKLNQRWYMATVSSDVSIWLEPVAKLVRGESMHMHPYYFQNIIYIF